MPDGQCPDSPSRIDTKKFRKAQNFIHIVQSLQGLHKLQDSALRCASGKPGELDDSPPRRCEPPCSPAPALTDNGPSYQPEDLRAPCRRRPPGDGHGRTRRRSWLPSRRYAPAHGPPDDLQADTELEVDGYSPGLQQTPSSRRRAPSAGSTARPRRLTGQPDPAKWPAQPLCHDPTRTTRQPKSAPEPTSPPGI